MFQGLIIIFRETLEAALVVGIVLSYLKRTGQQGYKPIVRWAVLTGIALSGLGAIGFRYLAEGFSGRNEEIFEGLTMLAGAALLTTMILWMMRQGNAAERFENEVAARVTQSRKWSLFLLVTVSILREGIESVIFLGATSFSVGPSSLIGGLIGLAAAVAFSFLLMQGAIRISLKKFLFLMNVILILFAAGLVAHGLHELQEAGLIPVVIEHVWDINPQVAAEGPIPLFHEQGHLGSIFKGLFGYNGNPSLLEVLFYVLYLAAVSLAWIRIDRRHPHRQKPDGGMIALPADRKCRS